ncbi:hypothetical protein JXM67_08725 [candidate division WOR-3 bacterium]|nr:hypothetical protein [candidate division WOR-3 bacterium]
MKKILMTFLALVAIACGIEGRITGTWISVSDYSMEVESGAQGAQVSVPPSLRVEDYDTTFTDNLDFTLHYPSAEDRLDMAILSVFSSDKPELELPTIKVDADYMLFDTLIEDTGFDNPLFEQGEWTELDTYGLKPGHKKQVQVPKAAGHKLVVVRCLVSIADSGETTGEDAVIRYMFGFELE